MKVHDVPLDSLIVHSPEELAKNIWPWATRLKGCWDFNEDAVVLMAYEKASNFRQRSLGQNNLYWAWMQALATFFSGRKNPATGKPSKFSKEDMHDLMRHNFVGYKNRRVGSTDLTPVLRSTADLDPGAMGEYMTKIDVWAQEKGCFLPYPPDSEYAKYKDARL